MIGKIKAKKQASILQKEYVTQFLKLAGLNDFKFSNGNNDSLDDFIAATINGNSIAEMGSVKKSVLEKFSIKQPVFYLYINWQQLLSSTKTKQIVF